MSNLNKANEIVKANLDKGAKVIRALILIEGLAVTDKEVTKLLKENGVSKTTSGFTQTDTLALLEGGVSEFTLYERILKEGAKNEARWVSDRNRIRIVLNKVYENLGSPVKEKAATDSQKAEIKTLLAK